MSKLSARLAAFVTAGVLTLTGCASGNPQVAAYVGAAQISQAQVDAVVARSGGDQLGSHRHRRRLRSYRHVDHGAERARARRQPRPRGCRCRDADRQAFYATNDLYQLLLANPASADFMKRLRRHRGAPRHRRRQSGVPGGGRHHHRPGEPAFRRMGSGQRIGAGLIGFPVRGRGDPAGVTHSQLERLVAVMHRLRTGCPWDAEQTHALPGALPGRGDPGSGRGDRGRRRRPAQRGTRRPAAPGGLPRRDRCRDRPVRHRGRRRPDRRQADRPAPLRLRRRGGARRPGRVPGNATRRSRSAGRQRWTAYPSGCPP